MCEYVTFSRKTKEYTDCIRQRANYEIEFTDRTVLMCKFHYDMVKNRLLKMPRCVLSGDEGSLIADISSESARIRKKEVPCIINDDNDLLLDTINFSDDDINIELEKDYEILFSEDIVKEEEFDSDSDDSDDSDAEEQADSHSELDMNASSISAVIALMENMTKGSAYDLSGLTNSMINDKHFNRICSQMSNSKKSKFKISKKDPPIIQLCKLFIAAAIPIIGKKLISMGFTNVIQGQIQAQTAQQAGAVVKIATASSMLPIVLDSSEAEENSISDNLPNSSDNL